MAALKKKKKILKKSRPESGSRQRSGKAKVVKKTAKKAVVKRRAVIKKKVVKKVISKKLKAKRKIKVVLKKKSPIHLKRVVHNPIINPDEKKYWESKAAFNPAALYYDGKVHIIYRAIGDTDMSVLGYANSTDGIHVDEHSKELAFYTKNAQPVSRTTPNISYCSGGGWGGGSEDPRLTLLGDKVYLIYTAFDGWGSVRMALTSISLDDFIKRRWDWKKPVLISPPGQIHKNWVLFPEKIKGKYAILHSISPKIMIDYFDDLDELNGENFIYSVHQGSPLWAMRDRYIRGVGPTPIKTKYGWLVLYHKMEKHETHRYKLWAMILDSKDPTKILYNSKTPILEPDLWYENEGYKSGVVYSCGAVVKEGKLFVYYGGADKVSCVAIADLEKFLKELMSSGTTKLKKKK